MADDCAWMKTRYIFSNYPLAGGTYLTSLKNLVTKNNEYHNGFLAMTFK